MRFATLLPVAALVPACQDASPTSDADLLEAVTVVASGESVDTAAESSQTFSGAATVSASGRDISISLDTDAGPVSVAIHSPGEADLSALDGQALTVTVPGEDATWGFAPGLAVIEDAAGPAWVAEVAGGDPADADALFGEGFVTWGEDLGKGTIDNADAEQDKVIFTSVLVQADDGPVELFAGDSAWITVDGQPWRFTLVAAYRFRDTGGRVAAACMDAPDVLSFEMVRGEATGEDRVIDRAPGALAARSDGC